MPENTQHRNTMQPLASASELKPNDTRVSRIKDELSASGRYWEQDHGGAVPLMPFDDKEIPLVMSAPFSDPLKLAGFEVKDISPIHHLKNAVSVGEVLSIVIGRNHSIDISFRLDLGFSKRPGFSMLVIIVEGVYVEMEGEERLMCLLGSSTMPSQERVENLNPFNFSNINSYSSSKDNRHIHLLDDNQVLVILRYPPTFNLTSRAIGEMRSLNERGSTTYFDQVRITSQLGKNLRYRFSETVLLGACDESPYQDELIEDGAYTFDAENFCWILHNISSFDRFSMEPNYNFNITGLESIGKKGPFSLAMET